MRVYLAARYSRYPEMQAHAVDLIRRGHEVTARWINGNHQISTEEMEDAQATEKRREFAQHDWDDLLAAECIVSFTEPQYSTASRGGRHVELGIGLGLGKRIIVVGYRENVFHCLPQIEFYETWRKALASL